MPSLRNAGLSVGIFSTFDLNGLSSLSIVTSPFLPATASPAISHENEPSVFAFFARSVDAIA